jgi:hypothetical protein
MVSERANISRRAIYTGVSGATFSWPGLAQRTASPADEEFGQTALSHSVIFDKRLRLGDNGTVRSTFSFCDAEHSDAEE